MNLDPQETAFWTLAGGAIGTGFDATAALASGLGLGVTVGGVGSNAVVSAGLAASAASDAAWMGMGSVLLDSVVGALLGAGGGLLNAGVSGTKYTWEQMRVDLGFGIFSGWVGNVIGPLDELLNRWGVGKGLRFLSRSGLSGAGNAGLNALQRFLLNECSSWDDLVQDFGLGAIGSAISDVFVGLDRTFLPSDKYWQNLAQPYLRQHLRQHLFSTTRSISSEPNILQTAMDTPKILGEYYGPILEWLSR